jgi:DNA invertase Pin-like site-specific DNA recombinase
VKARDVGLKVLTRAGASIDTTKPEGRLFFALFAAFSDDAECVVMRSRSPSAEQTAT